MMTSSKASTSRSGAIVHVAIGKEDAGRHLEAPGLGLADRRGLPGRGEQDADLVAGEHRYLPQPRCVRFQRLGVGGRWGAADVPVRAGRSAHETWVRTTLPGVGGGLEDRGVGNQGEDDIMTTTPHRRDFPAPVLESDGDRHPVVSTAAGRVLAVLRIVFGLTFLWAFVDKLFGLGYASKSGKGWVDGGDDHIVGAVTVIALALVAAGNVWGLGKWWGRLDFVREYPWLR
jgi:hypothetical protein